ncbi:hypothetical protein D3C85_1030770 [compost metagenome]
MVLILLCVVDVDGIGDHILLAGSGADVGLIHEAGHLVGIAHLSRAGGVDLTGIAADILQQSCRRILRRRRPAVADQDHIVLRLAGCRGWRGGNVGGLRHIGEGCRIPL